MMNVANRKMIHKLTLRSLKASKVRNIIAVIAITLTAVLFTSIFTVLISMNFSMEQQYMRMAGGYAHGSFKYLTEKQVDQLKAHPLIKEYGISLMLSFPMEAPFNKHHTEIRYGNENSAEMYFSHPTTGSMPKGRMELATDTTVLDLLKVPYKIGEKVTLSYPLGNKTVTDTFTLSGYWKTDEAGQASQIWLSEEYVREKLTDYQVVKQKDMTGTWNLDVMFSNSRNIAGNLKKIAEDNGYNIEDKKGDNYLDTGVNWAYTSTHVENGTDITMIIAVAALLLLITFTGYLIIYNIFQISVANDIRYFGLLKTIGTTPKQIGRIVRNQAVLLSGLGIPLGLIIGFVIGNRITPVIMSITFYKTAYVTTSPWIFIGAAVFTLFTVAVSLRKPAKMAARVSPIEAVRYSEGNSGKKKIKNSTRGTKVYKMARENLKLSPKKTALVILSLSLSVILLNATYTFAKGFDMDKFLEKFVVTDFIVGSADYFSYHFNGEDQKVTDSIMEKIDENGGIRESGKVYGKTFIANITLDVDTFKKVNSWYTQEELEAVIKENAKDGKIPSDINLYGLEDFPMKQLTVLDGKLDPEKIKNGHYLAQVVFSDDYGKVSKDDAVFKIGDKVKIHYCTDYEYSEDDRLIEKNGWDVEYEIITTVLMPGKMSVRSYGPPQFILSADTFKKDTKTANAMIYMYNMKDKKSMAKMEDFIKEYTGTVEPDMNYESKSSITNQFLTFRNMFLMVGGLLSFIVGMVGILNFINAELTSIMTRRREFAMLQSIGMTGKQLKAMLIFEGLFYGGISIILSFFFSILVGVIAIKPIEGVLWFFSFRFTVTPILILLPVFLILGTVIPLLAYRFTNRRSIVDRLREAE